MSIIPRRNSIDHMTPAELAIRNAMEVVDRAGIHPLLTDAVRLLMQAKDKVGDWVDRDKGVTVNPPAAIQRLGPGEKIDHPAHYGGADDPYEAIKVIEAWGLGFCLGNTVKYIAREGKKGAPIEDLKKARWGISTAKSRTGRTRVPDKIDVLDPRVPGKIDVLDHGFEKAASALRIGQIEADGRTIYSDNGTLRRLVSEDKR